MSLQRRFKKSAPVTVASKHITGIHNEDHYTVSELATKWKLSDDSIRQLFLNEIGVMKIVRPEDLSAVVVRDGKKKRGKRAYVTLRIPASIAIRVHERLHGKIAA